MSRAGEEPLRVGQGIDCLTSAASILLPPDLEDLAVADLWEAGHAGGAVDHGGGRPAAAGGVVSAGIRRARGDWEPGVEAGRRGDDPGRRTGSPPGASKARPFPIGTTLFVDPREPDEEPAGGPGGTAAAAAAGPRRVRHGQPRVDLAWPWSCWRDADLRGRRVLDVGTGTGVLAFAALAFGARSGRGLRRRSGRPLPRPRQQRPERSPPPPVRRPPGRPAREAPLRPGPGQRRPRADPPGDAGPGRLPARRGRGDPLGHPGASGAGRCWTACAAWASSSATAARPGTGSPSGSDRSGMTTLARRPCSRCGIAGESCGSRARPTATSSGPAAWRSATDVRVVDGRGRARWGEVARVDRTSALRDPRRAGAGQRARVPPRPPGPHLPARARLLAGGEGDRGRGLAPSASCNIARAPRDFGAGTLDRLRRVAAAAVEQCHRLPPARDHRSPRLEGGSAASPQAPRPRWVLDPEGGRRLAAGSSDVGRPSGALLVGPEGGLAPEEQDGAAGVRLAPGGPGRAHPPPRDRGRGGGRLAPAVSFRNPRSKIDPARPGSG